MVFWRIDKMLVLRREDYFAVLAENSFALTALAGFVALGIESPESDLVTVPKT